MRRYVLTGTPGAGKTTLLRQLRDHGYATVAEAATTVIAREQANGRPEPWNHADFIDHDGAAKGPKPIGYGNCWVVLGVIVDLPLLRRPVCLPLLARLWFPKGTRKIAHARAMVERVATRYPDRSIHVVGDAAYISEHLRELGDTITWTSRLKVTSVLYQPPPPRTGRVGRPKTRGPRLGTPGDLAAAATWHKATVRRYGRTDTVQIAEAFCIWFGVLRTQLLRVILVRDDKPRTKDKDERGYGLPLVTTDLTTTPEDLIARYASRLHRAGLLQRPAHPRGRRGTQPATHRRPAHRTVRPDRLQPDRALVHPPRPRPRAGRAAARPPALVHHQDRAVLRGHGHQTAPRHHRRPFSAPRGLAATTRRNPRRPTGLGRSRNMINQNCETRGVSLGQLEAPHTPLLDFRSSPVCVAVLPDEAS